MTFAGTAFCADIRHSAQVSRGELLQEQGNRGRDQEARREDILHGRPGRARLGRRAGPDLHLRHDETRTARGELGLA